MRLVYDIRSRQFVNTLSSGQVLGDPTYKLTRRDSETIEFQVFTEEGGLVVVKQLPVDYELRFAARRMSDWPGPAVAYAGVFAYIPADAVYAGNPSFNTDEVTAMFVGAAGVNRYTDSMTIDADDFGRLVCINSQSDETATIPLGLGAGSEAFYVLALDADVTLAATTGVTLNLDPNVSAVVTQGSTLKVTRTGLNAWTASIPSESDSITVMAQFSWRSVTKPDDWTSTIRFRIILDNNVVRDGAPPQSASNLNDYVTQSQLDNSFLRADVAQSFSEDAKNQLCDNAGALRPGGVVTTSPQSLLSGAQDQARTNINAASITSVTNVVNDVAALTLTVGGKASNSALATTNATVAALSSQVLVKGVQSLTDSEKSQVRTNIGARAIDSDVQFTRLTAMFYAVGNGAVVHLTGAANIPQGTPTIRNVEVFDAGHSITSWTGAVVTATAHGGIDGQLVQFSATVFPVGSVLVAAGEFFYLKNVTTNTFEFAATPGGTSVTLSGTATSFKVLLSVPFFKHHRRLGFVSAATANASCGTRHGQLQWSASGSDTGLGRWTFSARFGNSDALAVANARTFVGMIGMAGLIGNVNPSTLVNIIGLGADTGDANMQVMHNDNSGTATKIDLGSDFPANTINSDVYQFELTVNNDGTVLYRVINMTNGSSASANISTNLPHPMQLLSPQLWRHNGTTARAVGLDVHQWFVSHRS